MNCPSGVSQEQNHLQALALSQFTLALIAGDEFLGIQQTSRSHVEQI